MNWWNSLKHKARLARALHGWDWCMLVSAWVQLAVSRLKLRFLSYESLLASLPPVPQGRANPQGDLMAAQRLQRIVYLASRLLTGTACLPRALVLARMLARRGIPANICIGVGESIAAPQAHAWVEVAGQAVGEPEDLAERFQRLQPAGTQATPRS